MVEAKLQDVNFRSSFLSRDGVVCSSFLSRGVVFLFLFYIKRCVILVLIESPPIFSPSTPLGGGGGDIVYTIDPGLNDTHASLGHLGSRQHRNAELRSVVTRCCVLARRAKVESGHTLRQSFFVLLLKFCFCVLNGFLR